MDPQIQRLYGDRTRVRACGLCIEGERILLVNHAGLREGDFWAPPGGGVEFGESAVDALAREFVEETGLRIEVGEFLFVCELVAPPLHAVELFFRVTTSGGALVTGSDPESGKAPSIREARFHTFGDLDNLPSGSMHGIFDKVPGKAQISSLRGYFRL